MRYKALIPAPTIEHAVAYANNAVNAGTAVRLITIVVAPDGQFIAVVESAL